MEREPILMSVFLEQQHFWILKRWTVKGLSGVLPSYTSWVYHREPQFLNNWIHKGTSKKIRQLHSLAWVNNFCSSSLSVILVWQVKQLKLSGNQVLAKIKFKEQLLNYKIWTYGTCNFYICTVLASVERTTDPLGTVNASILQTWFCYRSTVSSYLQHFQINAISTKHGILFK